MVQFTEDLAVITALNHSGSFGKNFVKFKGKKIVIHQPNLRRSVLGKTVPEVLSAARGLRPTASGGTKTEGTFFSIRTYRLANNIYILLLGFFPAVFRLLLEVRVFESDRSARLNFSLIEVQLGSSSSCHRCFLSDRTPTHCRTIFTFALQQRFTHSPSSSVCSMAPSEQFVTVKLLEWLTGSWHVRVEDTKILDLLKSTPPNGFPSLSLLLLHFQSFSRDLTP